MQLSRSRVVSFDYRETNTCALTTGWPYCNSSERELACIELPCIVGNLRDLCRGAVHPDQVSKWKCFRANSPFRQYYILLTSPVKENETARPLLGRGFSHAPPRPHLPHPSRARRKRGPRMQLLFPHTKCDSDAYHNGSSNIRYLDDRQG